MKREEIKELGRLLFWLGLLFLLIVAVFGLDYACWRAQHPDAPTWSYGCHCMDNGGGNRSKK